MSSGKNDEHFARDESIAIFMKLTPREKSLLRLLTMGYTNRQAADHLHISMRTVEFHKSKLKEKVRATDLKGLIHFANSIQEYD